MLSPALLFGNYVIRVGTEPPQVAVLALRQELGLDDPLPLR
jgi:hypothetical protein